MHHQALDFCKISEMCASIWAVHLSKINTYILHQQHTCTHEKPELINVQRDKYYCMYSYINTKLEGNKNLYTVIQTSQVQYQESRYLLHFLLQACISCSLVMIPTEGWTVHCRLCNFTVQLAQSPLEYQGETLKKLKQNV
jgi:hypothetical protein